MNSTDSVISMNFGLILTLEAVFTVIPSPLTYPRFGCVVPTIHAVGTENNPLTGFPANVGNTGSADLLRYTRTLARHVTRNLDTDRWGRSIKKTHVPMWIVQEDTLLLANDELAVYLVLLHHQKSMSGFIRKSTRRDRLATVRLSRDEIIKRTGYSVGMVADAIRRLKARKYIYATPNHQDRRNKGSHFCVTTYMLLNDADGNWPLTLSDDSLLYGNGKIRYFTFPSAVIESPGERYSLAKLTGSALRLYVAVCITANRANKNDVSVKPGLLKTLTGLDKRTLRRALEELERDRGLVFVHPTDQSERGHVRIELLNPMTGLSLTRSGGNVKDDPANWYTTNQKGVSRQVVLNSWWKPEEVERAVYSLAPDGLVKRLPDDLMIRCPFHDDRNPSCSVSLSKSGVWRCFGCTASGNFQRLLQRLRDVQPDISHADLIERLAVAQGKTPFYRRPDEEAIAIYNYKNAKVKLLKQVRRFPGKEFDQRRPVTGGGYIYELYGMPSMLYHLELIGSDLTDTVVVCEGEQDADCVTQLKLLGGSTWNTWPVIGLTSGSYNSWQPQLAKHLLGKRVIILPDNDAMGEKYAQSVRNSLDREGIEYRDVSFHGTGAKDVTEYLEHHPVEALVRLIGVDWVRLPNGRTLMPNVKIDFDQDQDD